MPAPMKLIKSGNFEVSVWDNERDMEDGGIISFRTVSLRKYWRDNNNTIREQKLSLRKQDVERVLVMLGKIQEYLVLEEGEHEERRKEH